MTVYKIKGQSGTVEQVITLSAESPEQALEVAKKYFPRTNAWSDICQFE